MFGNSKDYANLILFGRYLLCFLLLVVLQTHGTLDPSVYTLVSPNHGIENWLGTLGALVASFLIEHFGLGAWSLPIFLMLGSFKTGRSRAVFFWVLILFISAFTWALGTTLLGKPIELGGAEVGGAFGVLSLSVCDNLAKRVLFIFIVAHAWFFLIQKFQIAIYWQQILQLVLAKSSLTHKNNPL